MKEIILIKNGELVLKGLNRNTFEDTLIRNIRRHLKEVGNFSIKKAQSTIFIEPADEDFDMDTAIEKVAKIFGIAGYSRACVCEKDINDIMDKAVLYLTDVLSSAKTFKVEAKRSDKRFAYKSPEISAMLGGKILECFPEIRVDVHSPEITVTVEVRDFKAYVRANQLAGAGGLPTGTAGKAAILISGGIDSPVAAWTMAKRGLELDAIHFASPPYTSPRAELKVRQLLGKVADYSNKIKLCVVPFTEIQQQIAEHCPEEYFTLIMRRMMMRIAERIARQQNCLALITGESLGQVASQTLPALAVTDSVVNIPTLRPLIGMDKEEIVRISRKIDTFDISIQPYEDCCTVFTPKHPRTKPTNAQCEEAEKALDIEKLVNEAVINTVYSLI